MSKCESCPAIAACDQRIELTEATLQASLNSWGGIAQLAYEADRGPDTDLAMEILADHRAAIEKRAEEGKAQLTPFLARTPKAAAVYFEVVDVSIAMIETTQEIRDRLEGSCDGPKERKRFLFFGRTAIHCQSSALLLRLAAKRNQL